MNSLDLAGSDVFREMFGLETNELGKTWAEPVEQETLKPSFEISDGVERLVAVSDFLPGWHKSSEKLLGTGHTVVYTPDCKVTSPRPRHTSGKFWSDRCKQNRNLGNCFGMDATARRGKLWLRRQCICGANPWYRKPDSVRQLPDLPAFILKTG
ncbi:MAG: hypothetical protein K0B11_08940 [Mariniphaga sp.]|nr:hypothetical protein [Mariniphaga sp.]